MSIHNQIKDEDLILMLRNGDETAFTKIYNRYWDKLYYIAYKLLRDTDAAEEIVQEVFLVLWQKRDNLNIHSVTQYLAAMTRYAVFRYLSKQKRYKVKESMVALSGEFAVAEINVDHKILLEMITQLSNKLPEKCRLVFQYNKLQDKSLADVAAQLNITQKTAEGHLTKALRMIRANVGDALSIATGIIYMFLFKE